MRNTRSTTVAEKNPKVKEKSKRKVKLNRDRCKNSESDNCDKSSKFSDNNSSSDADNGKNVESDNCLSPSKLAENGKTALPEKNSTLDSAINGAISGQVRLSNDTSNTHNKELCSNGDITTNGTSAKEVCRAENISTVLEKYHMPDLGECSNPLANGSSEEKACLNQNTVSTQDKAVSQDSFECFNGHMNGHNAEEVQTNKNLIPDQKNSPHLEKRSPERILASETDKFDSQKNVLQFLENDLIITNGAAINDSLLNFNTSLLGVTNGIHSDKIDSQKNALPLLENNLIIKNGGDSVDDIFLKKSTTLTRETNGVCHVKKCSNGDVTLSATPPDNGIKDNTQVQNLEANNGCSELTNNVLNETTKENCNSTSDESLGAVLKDLKLFDELYDFLKLKHITTEALKFMKLRHIDELFQGMSLHLKILFEHRLLEWQERLKKRTHDEEERSLKITQKICYGENCQLLSVERKPSGSISSYHITGDQDLSNFSNRLMEVIHDCLNTVLMEFNVQTNKNKNQTNEEIANNVPEIPTAYIIQPDVNQQNAEKPSIISVVNLSESQPPGTMILDPATLEHTSLGEIVQTETASRKAVQTDENDVPTCDKNNPRTKRPSKHIISRNMLEPSLNHFSKRKWGIETEVKEILLMYKPGNLIIKHYKSYGTLTPKLRSDLVHIIVDHFVANNEFVCINLCRDLAAQIVELFPTETADTYFYQENRRTTPRGKLWNHYQNERRTLKKDTPNTYTRSNRLKMESTCVQLKNITDPDYLLKKWQSTFQYRRYQLHSGYFSNWKMYFDEYPFCKQENYATFIDADLAMTYPELSFDEQLWDNFLNNYQIHFWNRCKTVQSKAIYDELCSINELNVPTDYFAIRLFQLLNSVFNGAADTSDIGYLNDPLRQFTVEVSNLVELKEIVIERKRYCLENNRQCKPYIAAVRENNTYVHYSVVIDSTGFGCDNFKESLILCFKLYLFFDICYPEESFCLWLFIQKYFFNKLSVILEPVVDTFIDDIRSQNKVDLEVRAVDTT
ncbi:uncharacterized protein isoform X2 [Musca autumnalis]|uniref:uncharacterized protein isoform X2 n=1 Tax=Musca autumnalis TaxID=221902 RepID=UPI003CEE1DC5